MKIIYSILFFVVVAPQLVAANSGAELRTWMFEDIRSHPHFIGESNQGEAYSGYLVPNEPGTASFDMTYSGSSDIFVGVGSVQSYSLVGYKGARSLVLTDISDDVIFFHHYFWRILFLAADSPKQFASLLKGEVPSQKSTILKGSIPQSQNFDSEKIYEYVHESLVANKQMDKVGKMGLYAFRRLMEYQLQKLPTAFNSLVGDVDGKQFAEVVLNPDFEWSFLSDKGFDIVKKLYVNDNVYYARSELMDPLFWESIAKNVPGKVTDAFLSNVPAIYGANIGRARGTIIDRSLAHQEIIRFYEISGIHADASDYLVYATIKQSGPEEAPFAMYDTKLACGLFAKSMNLGD